MNSENTRCEIIDYLISFTRIVDEDERIKDDETKILALTSLRSGLETIIELSEIKKIPNIDIIENIDNNLYNIAIKDLSPAEIWKMIKEYLNKEYKNCY